MGNPRIQQEFLQVIAQALVHPDSKHQDLPAFMASVKVHLDFMTIKYQHAEGLAAQEELQHIHEFFCHIVTIEEGAHDEEDES